MNIYDKIYLLSTSTEDKSQISIDISSLVPESRYNKSPNESTKSLSNAVSWAISNGFMQISPKTGKAVIKHTDLVRSKDIRNMINSTSYQMTRLKQKIGVLPEFNDPVGVEYYKPEAAKKILQASILE